MNSLSRNAKTGLTIALVVIAAVVLWKVLVWALALAIKIVVVGALVSVVVYAVSRVTGWKPLPGGRRSLP